MNSDPEYPNPKTRKDLLMVPQIFRPRSLWAITACFAIVATAPAAAFDLYWTEEEAVVASDIDGSNVTVVFDGTGMDDIAIDIRITESHIYWTERHVGRIWQANRDGSDADVFFDGGEYFDSLHFMEWDEANEKIYVSDYPNGIFEIDLAADGEVRNLDGTGFSNFTGVALRGENELLWITAADNELYTTDLTAVPDAEGTELVGGNQTYGLAYDAESDILYYTDFGSGNLYSYDLDTGSNLLLGSGFTGLLGAKLSPSGSHLVLAERGAGISAYQIDNGATDRLVEREEVDFGVAVDADPGELEAPEFLFYTDFQDDVLDEPPGAPWTSVTEDPETGGTVRVRQDSEEFFLRGTGNHYLDFDDIGDSPTILWATDAVPGNEDVFTVSFDFFEPFGSAGNRFVVNLYNPEGTDGRIDRLQFEGGEFRGIDDVTYSRGVVNRMDFVVNSSSGSVSYGDQDEHTLSAHTSDIWINGEKVLEGYRDAGSDAGGPIAGLDLRAFSNAPVTMYVDDFGIRAGTHLSEIREGVGADPGIIFFDDFNSVNVGEEPAAPWRTVDSGPDRGTAYVQADTDELFSLGSGNQFLDFHSSEEEEHDSPLILWAHRTVTDVAPRVFTITLDFHEPEDSHGHRFNLGLWDDDPDVWPGFRIDQIQFEHGTFRNMEGEDHYTVGRTHRLNWVVNRDDDPVTYNDGQNTIPPFSSDVWIDDRLVAEDWLHDPDTDMESTNLGGFDIRTFSNNYVRMFVDQVVIREGAAPDFRVVDVPAGFAEWRAEHFTSEELEDEAISGPGADPAGDGIANAIKYALGMDPRVPATADLPVEEIREIDGERYLTLTFTRPDDRDDVDYRVDASGDLDEWPDQALRVDELTVDHGDGTTSYTYRDVEPIGNSARRFLRLNVGLTE